MSSDFTFICDMCGEMARVPDDRPPGTWLRIPHDGSDLCPNCIRKLVAWIREEKQKNANT